MEEMRTPHRFDKQLILEIIVVLLLLGLGFWLYFNGALDKSPSIGSYARPGDCLVLPQQYCGMGVTIDYLGHEALGFNLPADTPIYMPFDGAYFEDSLGASQFVRIRLGIPETSSFVVMVARHAPFFESGEGVDKGNLLAVTVFDAEEGLIDVDSNSNFVIYTEDYDILNIF